jgi:hypothetical protein
MTGRQPSAGKVTSTRSTMSTLKILVIGSTGHQHVRCVRWEEIFSANIVDFDLVVVNVRSFTDKLARSDFRETRKALARLLFSDGRMVVLGEKRRNVKTRQNWSDNYCWSPIRVGTTQEAGTTIIPVDTSSFEKYFAHFKKWDYYYFLPQGSLTNELTDICGSPSQYKYPFNLKHYVENRYHQLLGGTIKFTVSNSMYKKELGDFILLPCISELEQREAVNIVLEDLLSLPQITLPPEWAETVPMPVIPAIQATIDEKKRQISLLNGEIAEEEKKKQGLEAFKKLLYATGTELENIFAACLARIFH